jgi:Fur family ferric uptake transcriptional regulator
MAPSAPGSKHTHHDADAPAILRDAGLKVTKPRRALLEIMIRDHGPFTAEELHERFSRSKTSGPCDLVTIYRCLSKFEHLGLITRCDFGDGSIRYEIKSVGHAHHHHIICQICRKAEPLPDCPIDDRTIDLPKLGYQEVHHRLEFFGVCPACYKQKK